MKEKIQSETVRERTRQGENAQKLSSAEERALKMAAQFFGKELLEQLGIKGRIKDIFPTEYVHLEMKQLSEDFNYLMENGDCFHFEFESDRLTKEDLRRFRAYEAVCSYTRKIPVVTHVVCSADVKRPRFRLAEGINTYRVRVIRMKGKRAENVFQELENKPVRDWKREELLEVALSPLMGGKMTQEERIRQGFRILKEECPGVSKEDQKKLQSILYVFALKFLKKEELERMEEIRMTVLGQMLVDEGFHKGLSQGLSEGLSKGKDQGEKFMGKLVQCLARDKRLDEIDLAIEEPEIRKKLYREYHIEE